MIAETMTTRSKIAFLSLSCSLVLLILAGTLMGEGDDTDKAFQDLKTFTHSLRLVRRYYVDDVDLDRVMRGAYRGLVERLDPFSSYLAVEDRKRIEGLKGPADVGITLVRGSNGYLRVGSVRYGSPAWEAGVRPGRWIENIGDRASKDTSLMEGQALLRGAPGSTLHLRFFEEGDEKDRDVTFSRRVPDDHLLLHDLADAGHPGTAHLRLLDLRKGSAAEVASVLTQLKERNIRDLVLDLRTNPGGDEKEMLEVADEFLDRGEVVEIFRRGEKPERIAKAHEGRAWTGDVVVLVGPGTMGEAEALAAALEGNGRAQLVGGRTLGKGFLQRLIEFPDGTAVNLSVEEYRGPGGLVFQGEGVKPDVLVQDSEEDGKDAVLDAGIETLQKEAAAAA